MSDTKNVRLVEVGPRDGLQNEKAAVSTQDKVALINALVDAGFETIEAGSFVSPKWVPQMSDSANVLSAIDKRPNVSYPVLTPNMRGLENALAAGATEVAIFGAASETFSKTNINCTIDESLSRFGDVASRALDAGARVRGYVSCVLGCPYEQDVDPAVVRDVSQALLEMGCYEVSLGDTIGVGTPSEARRLIEEVEKAVPVTKLAGHFHDTYGQALANIWAVLDLGVSVFDCSVAGLGGCPYAKGATGNVASEDVVYSLSRGGVETGIDLEKLVRAGAMISSVIGRVPVSRAANALLARAR